MAHIFISLVISHGSELVGLTIFIHIFIYKVIYKYTVYNTIMMGFRKKVKGLIQICFPFKEEDAQL